MCVSVLPCAHVQWMKVDFWMLKSFAIVCHTYIIGSIIKDFIPKHLNPNHTKTFLWHKKNGLSKVICTCPFWPDRFLRLSLVMQYAFSSKSNYLNWPMHIKWVKMTSINVLRTTSSFTVIWFVINFPKWLVQAKLCLLFMHMCFYHSFVT